MIVMINDDCDEYNDANYDDHDDDDDGDDDGDCDYNDKDVYYIICY